MNAFTPYEAIDWSATFADHPSWPLRFEEFDGTDLMWAAVESIANDADRVGNAEWAYIARYCLDNRDVTELRELIASEEEAEELADRAYCYEVRTGKEWPEERARIRAEADRQWNALPEAMNARDAASAHLAALPAERRAALNSEWEQTA